MIDLMKKLVAGAPQPEDSHEEKLRLAATALLFRALYVDGDARPEEEDQIRKIVTEEFGLANEAVDTLLVEARETARNASDLYGWTKIVNAEYSHDEKIYLMEKLWQVILADGRIDHHEHALMRRLAGLIYVSDSDSATARLRAASGG
ncbi:TerB family tellurite resistance protein [Alphaproteobacteria bacterium LSUCC0684]